MLSRRWVKIAFIVVGVLLVVRLFYNSSLYVSAAQSPAATLT